MSAAEPGDVLVAVSLLLEGGADNENGGGTDRISAVLGAVMLV